MSFDTLNYLMTIVDVRCISLCFMSFNTLNYVSILVDVIILTQHYILCICIVACGLVFYT